MEFKEYMGCYGSTDVFARFRLPWDEAVLLARIHQHGNGEFLRTNDPANKLVCENERWRVEVRVPLVGRRTIPLEFEDIWAGVVLNWRYAVEDCDRNFRPAEIEFANVVTADWSSPDNIREVPATNFSDAFDMTDDEGGDDETRN